MVIFLPPTIEGWVVMTKNNEMSVSLDAPVNGFPVNHFFNRFFIETVEKIGIVVHTTYQVSNGQSMGSFSFLIPYVDIERQKTDILRYIDAAAGIVSKGAFPQFYLGENPIHTVRFIHAGRTDSQAELLLYNVPIFQNTKKTGVVNADPIAALSSSVETHIEMLKQIYA